MKNLSLAILFVLLATASFSQTAANTWSVKFSNAIISRWPTTINSMTGKGWEYSNSIILHGMEKVYNDTGNLAYLNYIKKYVESYVDSSGNVTLAQTLDNIHPGILCLFLYEKTGLLKFKTAATNIRNFLLTGSSPVWPKTFNGGYWHKNQAAYTNVMMLDGIYMAYPFLVKYGRMFNDNICLDTATSQTLKLGNQLYDASIHLLRHAWNSDKAMTWVDPVANNGNSKEVWSRAMGWYTMALVDMLKYLPTTHPKYAAIKTMLANIAIGIQNTQDPTTGLWYQVMNKQDSVGNYLETSGSAMFVYALKVAADSGWISSSYLTVAQNGWTGLKANTISTYTDGKPEIMNFAPAMSVQANYTAYIGVTPVVTPASTAPHGYAAILMAASVMEFPLTSSSLPVTFTSFTATINGNSVQLDWNNPDIDNEVSYYSIQRSGDGTVFENTGRVNADGSSVYRWTDHNVTGNTIYYRIAAIGADGSACYSTIRAVRLRNSNPSFSFSPNPVVGRMLTLHITGTSAGDYNLYFINSEGKTIASAIVHVYGDVTNQPVPLPEAVRKGFYYIKLDIGSSSITKDMLVN